MEPSQGIFSREVLAGYDRAALEGGIVTLVGCGAAGNSIAQNLALAGIGELRFIDFDALDWPSNYTRAPLFPRPTVAPNKVRPKAREIAHAVLPLSYATTPTVRYAVSSVEALGLEALAGSHVVIAAVDRFEVRAYLADACRLLGVPLIECGFSAPAGQVSVYPNRADEEPCWRCAHPDAMPGGFSCATYAREIAARGQVPATQSVSAVIGGIVTEATIQALHGSMPLGGRVFRVDIRSGRSSVIELTTDEACPGVHRIAHDIITLAVSANDPLTHVLESVTALGIEAPAVKLPALFIVSAPCGACGREVSVNRPASMLSETPSCVPCLESESDVTAPLHSIALVRAGDRVAAMRARKLGLAPGTIVEIIGERTGSSQFVRLAGGPDDLFITKRRG